MIRRGVAALACTILLAQPAAAQDAKALLGTVAKTMGVEGLSSIHFYGVGAQGQLGQNNNANQPWPKTPLNTYVRAIDFTQPASRASWQTYAIPVTGGAATLTPGQQLITTQNTAWGQQLEIWTTPWGFIKGAIANNATARNETVGGRRLTVVTWNAPVKSPGGLPYRVVGYINADNLVERVQTWLENPVFGDMLVESDYTSYRDSNGLKYPTMMVQKRGGWPVFEAQILGAHANPPTLQALLTPPPPPAGRGGGPGGPGGPPPGGGGPAAGAKSVELAPGVYRIVGGYNALAIEFADHSLIFEAGPQNEARSQEIIAETRRLFPNKPVRYGVISHHHFDHTGGIANVAAEGITIVTPAVNRDFLMNALSGPRTLAPDALAKSKRKPTVEGFTGDKRVFQDGTRTFELHVVKGLPHADGNVIGYLPKEKILVYADMFNLPPANDPVPNPPVVGTGVFLDNIERLKLDVDRIMSVHSLNPDRLTSVADIRASLGRK